MSRIAELESLLADALEFISEYEDVNDGPKPNAAMSLAQRIREAVPELA